jgi:hypothetical protein
VTHFGPTAGSGNRFARLYAQQNKIVISRKRRSLTRTADAVEASEGLLGVIVADDFLGSGVQNATHEAGGPVPRLHRGQRQEAGLNEAPTR